MFSTFKKLVFLRIFLLQQLNVLYFDEKIFYRFHYKNNLFTDLSSLLIPKLCKVSFTNLWFKSLEKNITEITIDNITVNENTFFLKKYLI